MLAPASDSTATQRPYPEAVSPLTRVTSVGRCSDLVQVGEEEQAQLFAHVQGVHSEVILEFGDGDEAVDLGRQNSI